VTALVIVAACIATILLFRWARLLAMIALVITIGFFALRFEAWKATQPPLVHTVQSD
jgi:hypothetical protein